jgi:hypothetical protein
MAYIQSRRTWRAAEETRRMFEAFESTMLARGAREDNNELKRIQDRKKEPQLASLQIAFEARGHLEDLAICFLRRTKDESFILADHPVSALNQFAEGHPWLGRKYCSAAGIGSKGVQLLLPLSPELCLAIYDPSTYQYGNGKSLIINVGNPDVRKINMLQAASADSNLYMASVNPDLEYLNGLAIINRKASRFNKVRIFSGPVVDEGNGKRSQVIGYSMPDIRLGIRLSFVRVINKISYHGYDLGTFPPRSSDQVKRGEAYRNNIKAEVAKLMNKKPG